MWGSLQRIRETEKHRNTVTRIVTHRGYQKVHASLLHLQLTGWLEFRDECVLAVSACSLCWRRTFAISLCYGWRFWEFTKSTYALGTVAMFSRLVAIIVEKKWRQHYWYCMVRVRGKISLLLYQERQSSFLSWCTGWTLQVLYVSSCMEHRPGLLPLNL